MSETLVAAGLRDEIVGCTQFCIEPKDLHRSAQVVGGTKDFSIEKIRALKPTHILINQEENPRELVEDLMREPFPWHMSFPKAPRDVPPMIRSVGEFLGAREAFEPLARELEAMLVSLPAPKFQGRYLYFIWREPYMLAGPDTYISRLLELFGWENAYRGDVRYPRIEIPELDLIAPDICFFSSEPYPFRKRDGERLREEWAACPEIRKIDGRLMSWHGSALREALEMLKAVQVNGLGVLSWL